MTILRRGFQPRDGLRPNLARGAHDGTKASDRPNATVTRKNGTVEYHPETDKQNMNVNNDRKPIELNTSQKDQKTTKDGVKWYFTEYDDVGDVVCLCEYFLKQMKEFVNKIHYYSLWVVSFLFYMSVTVVAILYCNTIYTNAICYLTYYLSNIYLTSH